MATQDPSGSPVGRFPTPAWAPIQDLDTVDITGKRKDGGVDLVIAVSQPLDDSADTLDRIRRKVAYYLNVIDLDEFQAEMGHPPRDRTSVIIRCDFPIHPLALVVIDECQAAAIQQGVRLVIEGQRAEQGPRVNRPVGPDRESSIPFAGTGCVAEPRMELIVQEAPKCEPRTIATDPDLDLIASTLLGLEWSDITFVTLGVDNGDAMCVSGSHPDGFSAWYREGRTDRVSDRAPDSLEEMIALLQSYRRRDDRWRRLIGWG